MKPWDIPPTVEVEKISDQKVRVTLEAHRTWENGGLKELALVCRKHLKRDDCIVIHAEQEASYRCWMCMRTEENEEAAKVLMRVWSLLDPDGIHDAPLRSRAKIAFQLIDDFSEQHAIDGSCVAVKVYDDDRKRAASPKLVDEDDE